MTVVSIEKYEIDFPFLVFISNRVLYATIVRHGFVMGESA